MPPKYDVSMPAAAELQPVGQATFIATRAKSDAALLEEWCDGYDGHTRRAYERVGARFLETLAMPLRQAAVGDYRQAVAALGIKPAGTEASRATRATYTAAVKSFLGFAHGVGYLAFNPGPFLKVEKQARDLAKRIIDDIDVRTLIRAAKEGRDRLLIEVAYYGGLRVSELVGLHWSDVIERDNGRLQITSLEGKGGKVREVLLPAGVSDRLRQYRRDKPDNDPIFRSARRDGPITERAGVSDRLRQYRRDKPDNDPIFRSARRDGPITERAAVDIVKAAARDAGIAKPISPHWLRHAHISHALDNGAPVSLVSQSVGHSDLKTTSIYAHARPGDSSGLYLKDL